MLAVLGLFRGALGFLTGHPQLAAILGLAVALGITDWQKNHAESALSTLRKANAEAQAHSRLIEANAAKISETARNTLDQRQAQIIVRYKTLEGKVKQVPAPMGECSISEAWRDLWNAGAAP